MLYPAELGARGAETILFCWFINKISTAERIDNAKRKGTEGNVKPRQGIQSPVKSPRLLFTVRAGLYTGRQRLQSEAQGNRSRMDIELSAHGMTVLRALNIAVEKTGVLIEGNLFYHHQTSVTHETPPDSSRAHKRRNFLRVVNGCGRFVEIGFNAGHSALLALDRDPE